MNKETKYTSHVKLRASHLNLHMNMKEVASLLLIQEKLDGAAAESCKSG